MDKMSDLDRDAIRVAIGGVLFNAMNFPKCAIPYLLGQDMQPLNDKITDAVLDALTSVPKPEEASMNDLNRD